MRAGVSRRPPGVIPSARVSASPALEAAAHGHGQPTPSRVRGAQAHVGSRRRVPAARAPLCVGDLGLGSEAHALQCLCTYFKLKTCSPKSPEMIPDLHALDLKHTHTHTFLITGTIPLEEKLGYYIGA